MIIDIQIIRSLECQEWRYSLNHILSISLQTAYELNNPTQTPEYPKFVTNGINEVMLVENATSQNVTINLPKLPQQFRHLITDHYNRADELILEDCDCDGIRPLARCPHFQDPSFRALFEVLPKRCAHIDEVSPECAKEIKRRLVIQILQAMDVVQCRPIMEDEVAVSRQNSVLLQPPDQFTDQGRGECHIHRYIKRLFPAEYAEIFTENKKQPQKPSSLINVALALSFMSNIFLLIIKIVALVISHSMAVLASVTDSAMDILCGVVLYITVVLSKKGIKQGEYQRVLHGHIVPAKYFYAQRYESLGVLSFSSIMGTLALILIGQSINQIVNYAQGEKSVVEFSWAPMGIIICTIVLKFFLFVICGLVCKKYKLNQKDGLCAYRDDHRNDILTNSIGFAGAALTYFLSDQYKYCDPAASIILSLYILWNWSLKALEQMRGLAGNKTKQKQLDEFMMRLIHQFTCSVFITEVVGLIGYSSANRTVLEIIIVVPNAMTIAGAHALGQTIQTNFEQLDGVERCYVHVESGDCDNRL